MYKKQYRILMIAQYLVRLLQPANTPPSIMVTLVGSVTADRPVQSTKTP
jgi:hypothetical protein